MADSLIIRIREAQASHYQQLSCKMAGKWDHQNGIKEKMTGWGVVSRERHVKQISRSHAIRKGFGKNGGKIGVK